MAESLIASLDPQALLVFESPTPAPAWAEPAYKGRLAFIRCTQDQATPVWLQDNLLQRGGVEWIVKDLESSHSPFASRPSEVVEIILEFVEKFDG